MKNKRHSYLILILSVMIVITGVQYIRHEMIYAWNYVDTKIEITKNSEFKIKYNNRIGPKIYRVNIYPISVDYPSNREIFRKSAEHEFKLEVQLLNENNVVWTAAYDKSNWHYPSFYKQYLSHDLSSTSMQLNIKVVSLPKKLDYTTFTVKASCESEKGQNHHKMYSIWWAVSILLAFLILVFNLTRKLK